MKKQERKMSCQFCKKEFTENFTDRSYAMYVKYGVLGDLCVDDKISAPDLGTYDDQAV